MQVDQIFFVRALDRAAPHHEGPCGARLACAWGGVAARSRSSQEQHRWKMDVSCAAASPCHGCWPVP